MPRFRKVIFLCDPGIEIISLKHDLIYCTKRLQIDLFREGSRKLQKKKIVEREITRAGLWMTEDKVISED